MNVAAQKRRLAIALGIVAVCALVAAAAFLGVLPVAWRTGAFVAALVGGFAAQGWLIWGMARAKAPS